MSNEPRKEATVIYEIEGNEIKQTKNIVQEYIVGSDTQISMPEFKMFTELCKVRKLNPFLKEAYLIKYGSQPAQIVVGKDAILKRAINNKQFNGREQGIIVLTKGEEIIERKGTFKLDTDKLVGGWAKVYRKDWEYPTYISVSFTEVAQTKASGELNSNWNSKGATMVEKVALMRGLRETFAEDLGAMIDEDEAWNTTDARGSSQHIEKQKDIIEDVEIEEVHQANTTVNIDDI